MSRRRNTVRSVGNYSVVELVETYLNGKSDIVGYIVVGPGADSSWTHSSIEDALLAIEKLVEEPSRGPSP